jgi:Nif-specific regulatory protein
MSDDDIEDALLLALGALVRRQISADELLGRIVDVMADLLDADRGTLYLLDRDTDELVSIAAHLPEMPELRVPISQGVAGYVGRTGKTVNVPSSEEDARFWKKIDDTTGYQTDTMLCGPIFDSAEELIGVVQLLNKRNGTFGADDEELLEVLATQAASLLEQTTLPARPSLVARPERTNPDTPRPTLAERFNGVVGSGEKMTGLLRDIRRVAATEATVLLRGESGTGKTLLAQTIHDNSPRRGEPFVVVDCTTLPDGLIENELFGHERGAYTGATTSAEGKVAAAEGGTLFLDEVGDLPLALQGKLLSLLQNRSYMPVGSTTRRAADIRIVAATNRDLEGLVNEGTFREDLYYRLRVVQLEVPALRERSRDDLTSLIEHFVARAARRHGRSIERIDDDALELLLEHRWPGNVRELENCLESAVIFAEREITSDVLSLPQGLSEASSDDPFHDEPTMEELEARYISYLLKKHDGNRSATARTMKIGRNTLIRKLKRYDIDEQK